MWHRCMHQHYLLKCWLADFSRKDLLLSIGEHYFRSLLASATHRALLTSLANNMTAFLDNLDYLHTFFMDRFPRMRQPHFRSERDLAGDVIRLHYYSCREGLYFLVVGE